MDPGSNLRFHIESEEDQNKALRALVSNRYDAYLIDQIVPNSALSGADLTKKAHAGGCRSPVLLLTSLSDDDMEMIVEDCGASGHINKSLDLEERPLRNIMRFATRHNRQILEVREQLRDLQGQVANLIRKFNRS
jgi:DNA-binding response OmpR family regulator